MTSHSNRRDVLKATAISTAALAAVPVLAQRSAVPDPQTRYPTEPFGEQRQKWPALQRDMRPVPDCGETTYRGSGRLAGRKALLTGGDSGIGRAVAIAFSREGADIAINYYPTEEPDAQDLARLLRGEGRKVVLIPATSPMPTSAAVS